MDSEGDDDICGASSLETGGRAAIDLFLRVRPMAAPSRRVEWDTRDGTVCVCVYDCARMLKHTLLSVAKREKHTCTRHTNR